MSNPYGPNQPSQWGGPQAPNGQYPVGAQGGAVYGTPSAQQQPSGATDAGYGHAQPTVNLQAQPGYYQAPSPMPQVQPVGAPSYGSVGAMPPRQKSHAGLIIGIVVAIALWIGIRLMPESSRWYVAKDRLYEAIGALKRVRNEAVDGPIVDELQDIVTVHQAETSSEHKGFGHVWRTPWLRKLMIVGIFLAMTNQLTGVNTVMYYAPTVLQYAGMDTSSAIIAQVANGVMSVIGSALGIWLILKFRRRQILIADVIGVGTCLLAIAAVFQFMIAPYMNAQQTPPAWAAYVILGLMAVFMLIVQSSNGTIVWTMMGEIFPNHVRGVMNGTAIFCLWVVNAIVGWTFPVMIEGLGGGLTYTVYGIINLVVAVVLYRIMPETSDKSLEEIEKEMEERFS